MTALIVPASAGARAHAGPVNSALPAIVGTPKVEAPLSATPGTWSDATGITYSYAWEQCDPSGANCSPLPYTTQSISSLSALVGQTVRVVVTASAADGSATATSDAKAVVGAGGAPVGGKPSGGGLKVVFLSPRAHATVTTRAFTVRVRVTGATEPVHVRFAANNQGLGSASAAVSGEARTVFSFTQGGDVTLTAVATSGTKSGRASETVAHEPPVTAVQGQQSSFAAPGCRICLVRDARGDGAGPDLASAGATVAGGWLTFTVTSFDAIHNAGANQGHPMLTVLPLTNGPARQRAIGSGSPSDIPARITFVNAHTIRFRVRASAFGSAKAVLWQVWVLYPGDNLKDTLPLAHLGNDPRNCFIVTQLVRRPAGDYSFGRNTCTEAGVVIAKR